MRYLRNSETVTLFKQDRTHVGFVLQHIEFGACSLGNAEPSVSTDESLFSHGARPPDDIERAPDGTKKKVREWILEDMSTACRRERNKLHQT